MKVTRKAGKIEALRQTVDELGHAKGRVGWFPSAVYEGGQPVAGVAFVQEHGSAKRGIPPRPFMRPTATDKREAWAKTVAQLTKAAALGATLGGQQDKLARRENTQNVLLEMFK